MHLVMRYLCFFGIVKRQGVKRRMDKRSTSEEQKSGYLGLTRADEERHLADVISVAQQNLERAGADIRKVNEDLADLLETYDVKDKEGLALWNNATARLKENEYDLIRYEKARKKPYFRDELILRTASPRRGDLLYRKSRNCEKRLRAGGAGLESAHCIGILREQHGTLHLYGKLRGNL